MTENQRKNVIQLFTDAKLKMKQLEQDIYASDATTTQKSNMQHSLSKVAMFSGDAIEMALRLDTPAPPAPPAPATPEFCANCPFAKFVHYEEGGKLVAPGCTGYASIPTTPA